MTTERLPPSEMSSSTSAETSANTASSLKEYLEKISSVSLMKNRKQSGNAVKDDENLEQVVVVDNNTDTASRRRQQDVVVVDDHPGVSSPPHQHQLISPFSSSASAEDFAGLHLLSLDSCRKVSVVVCVQEPPTPPQLAINEMNQQHKNGGQTPQQQQSIESSVSDHWCLFPFPDHPAASNNTSNETQQQQQQLPSIHHHTSDMVLVNPSAFGKYIPTQVTIETARLVHQVAHISSEDWARKYTFHEIVWPKNMMPNNSLHYASNNFSTTSTTAGKSNSNSSMPLDPKYLYLAQSLAHDAVLRQSSRVVLNLGCRHPHKTMTLFGTQGITDQHNNNPDTPSSSASSSSSPPPDYRLLSSMYEQCGLIGVTLHLIQQLPHKVTVSLSMVELLPEDDHLWDWLVAIATSSMKPSAVAATTTTTTSSSSLSKSPLKIRHVDSRGPVLEGLTQVPIHSWTALPLLLRRAFASRRKRKHQPRGTLMATLHIQMKGEEKNGSDVGSPTTTQPTPPPTCVQIQFVNLVGLETKRSNDKDIVSSRNAMAGVGSRREYTAARKSLSSLGGVLRRLVERDVQHRFNVYHQQKKHANDEEAEPVTRSITTTGANSSIVSYRDSILTKLLQRSLEDPNSRIVVLAHVSPLREDYDGTVHTIHYVHRFMAGTGGAGATAKSPFDNGTDQHSRIGNSNNNNNKESSTTPTPTTTGATTTIWPFQARLPTTTSSGSMNSPTGQDDHLDQVHAEGGGAFTATSPMLNQVDKRSLMRSYVSDPRQRLAKVFNLSQTPNQNYVTFSTSSPSQPTLTPTLTPTPAGNLITTDPITAKDTNHALKDDAATHDNAADESQPQNNSINMYQDFDDEFKYHHEESLVSEDAATGDDEDYAAKYRAHSRANLPRRRPVSPVAKLLDSPDFGMSPLARYLSTSQYNTSLEQELRGSDEGSEPGSSLGLYGQEHNVVDENIFLPEIDKTPRDLVDVAASQPSISTFWSTENERDEVGNSVSTTAASPYTPYFVAPRWDLTPSHNDDQDDDDDDDDERETNKREVKALLEELSLTEYPSGVKEVDAASNHSVDIAEPKVPCMGGVDEVVAEFSVEDVSEEYSGEQGRDPRFFTWDFVSSSEMQESELPDHEAKDGDGRDMEASSDTFGLGSDDKFNDLAKKYLHDHINEDNVVQNDSFAHSKSGTESSATTDSKVKDTWWKGESSSNHDFPAASTSARPKFDPEGLVATETVEETSKRYYLDNDSFPSDLGTPIELALGRKTASETSSLLLRREMSRLDSETLYSGTFSPEDNSPDNVSRRKPHDAFKEAPVRDIDSMLHRVSQSEEPPLPSSKKDEPAVVLNDWVNDLELAIGEMRTLHNGVWQNSSLALRRLRVSLLSLQQQLMQTKSERDEARSNVELIRSEIRRESSRHQEEMAETQLLIQELEDKLRKAQADRMAVEKIAEEAIASQDSMEKRLSRLKKEVDSSHEDANATKQQRKTLLQAKEDLNKDLRSAKSQIERLQAEKREGDAALAKLTIHLQSAEGDRQRLLRELEEDRLSMEQLKTSLNSQGEGRLAALNEQLDSVKKERDELAQSLEQLKSEMVQLKEERDATHAAKTELETKTSSLQNQVSRWKTDRDDKEDRLQKLKTDLLRSKQECNNAQSCKMALEADIVDLNDQLKTLRSELDHVNATLSQQTQEYQHRIQERDAALASKSDLDALVAALTNQLSKTRDERAAKELVASEERTAVLNTIGEREFQIKRLQQEVTRLQQASTNDTSASMQTEQEIRADMTKLIAEISQAQKEVAESRQREDQWQQERDEVLLELEHANRAVRESRDNLDQLQHQLERAQSKKEKAEERARSMRAELRAFQEETRAKVQRVLEHKKDANTNNSSNNNSNSNNVTAPTALMDKMTEENLALLEVNRKLKSKVEVLLKEQQQQQRDFDSHRFGVLFESFQPATTADTSHNTTSNNNNHNQHRHRGDVVRSNIHETTMQQHGVEWPQHSLDSSAAAAPASALRAEEICSAIAMSAKVALEQSNRQVMKWKMRCASVEDEKEAEIAMLRAKLRTMESRHYCEED